MSIETTIQLSDNLLKVPALVALFELEKQYSYRMRSPQEARDNYASFVSAADQFLVTSSSTFACQHIDWELALRHEVFSWFRDSGSYEHQLLYRFRDGLDRLRISKDLKWLDLNQLTVSYSDAFALLAADPHTTLEHCANINYAFVAVRALLVGLGDLDDRYPSEGPEPPWTGRNGGDPDSKDIRHEVCRMLFVAHVDMWASHTALEVLDVIFELDAYGHPSYLTENVASLVVQLARIGREEHIQHAYLRLESLMKMAKERGLNFEKYYRRALNAMEAPSSARFVLNHPLQAMNAHRSGAISLEKYESVLSRIQENQNKANNVLSHVQQPANRATQQYTHDERRVRYKNALQAQVLPDFESRDNWLVLDVLDDVLAAMAPDWHRAAEFAISLASQVKELHQWRNFCGVLFRIAADMYLLGQEYETYLSYTDPDSFPDERHKLRTATRLSIQHAIGREPDCRDVLDSCARDVDPYSVKHSERFLQVFEPQFRDVYPGQTWFDLSLKERNRWWPDMAHHPLPIAMAGRKVQEKSGETHRPWPKLIYFPIGESVTDATQQLARAAANALREELGLPRIGEGWVTETLLKNTIEERFPSLDVIPHGRPRWLGQQHYDVWIPSLRVAVEYQGEQHSRPIEFFGGDAAFQQTVERDRRKVAASVREGVLLILVHSEARFDDVLNTIKDELKLPKRRELDQGEVLEFR